MYKRVKIKGHATGHTIVQKISQMYNMLNLVKSILWGFTVRVYHAVLRNNNTFSHRNIISTYENSSSSTVELHDIWYLSQCVASWRSLSWKGLGQRWPWSQVWLSDWWTGSPVVACGRIGVSVAGPESFQVEGVDLEGKTGQTQQFNSLIHELKVLSLSVWLKHLIVLQPNLSGRVKFTLVYVVPGSSLW